MWVPCGTFSKTCQAVAIPRKRHSAIDHPFPTLNLTAGPCSSPASRTDHQASRLSLHWLYTTPPNEHAIDVLVVS